MYIHHFRYLLLAIYIPGLIVVSYYWTVSESVRWLLATSRFERAEKALHRAAKFNNKVLSAKSLEIIRDKCQPTNVSTTHQIEEKDRVSSIPVTSIFTSARLFLRLLNLSICWMTCAFVYYGLNLSATAIEGDGNKYISFILVVASEIPGLLASIYLLDKIGRRRTLIITLVLAGMSVTGSALIPNDYSNLILLLFVGGKCSITCAFSSMYVFTAELWPTSLRNTIANLCSMIGRVGGMLAPFTPLLVSSPGVYTPTAVVSNPFSFWQAQITPKLPFFLFGGFAIAAAFLIVILPETLNCKLPETIEDAENVGRRIEVKS